MVEKVKGKDMIVIIKKNKRKMKDGDTMKD